jgi:hypothetical protein
MAKLLNGLNTYQHGRLALTEQEELTILLPVLHARLNRCGLYKTAHKMHETVRELGYEVAELIEKEDIAHARAKGKAAHRNRR